MNPNPKEQLETLLDSSNMLAVLDDLIQICNEKSEHVATNWQDDRLAAAWDDYADALNSAVAKIMKMDVQP